MKPKEQPLKDDLSNYQPEIYKSPSVTVDICICRVADQQLQVLLIRRGGAPFRGCWAIPGGFVDVDAEETLEQTADRELREETNLKGITTEQLRTYGDPKRDPRKRVITVAYYALVPAAEGQTYFEHLKAGDDADEARWFNLRDLPPKLAFDHSKILWDLLERLKGKVSYSALAFQLVPEYFTWRELQEVYEVILGRDLKAGNFRRKINAQYVLAQLNRQRASGGRPAKLLKLESQREF